MKLVSKTHYDRHQGITFTVEENEQEFDVLIYFVDAYVEMTRHKNWYGKVVYKNINHPHRTHIVIKDNKGNSVSKDIELAELNTAFKECVERLIKTL